MPKDPGAEGEPRFHRWWKETREAEASGVDDHFDKTMPKLRRWQRARGNPSEHWAKVGPPGNERWLRYNELPDAAEYYMVYESYVDLCRRLQAVKRAM